MSLLRARKCRIILSKWFIAGIKVSVGSKGLATYLITTTNGHILINSSFERMLPIIRGGVEKLGFRFTDIKILLASMPIRIMWRDMGSSTPFAFPHACSHAD
jgi:hypothetical protein